MYCTSIPTTHGLRDITNIAEAEALWRTNIPTESVFDLWEVRMAFHRHFRRPLRFLVGSTEGGEVFLPLSWVDESKAWCFFPGETWSGGWTWLEQNRLCRGDLDRYRLLETLGDDFHLRYVRPELEGVNQLSVDETGYLFWPRRSHFRMDAWWADLGPKRGKQLRRELALLQALGARHRPDEAEHFNLLVEMTLARFGPASYFADPRFREGFRDMLAVLDRMGCLRVTLVEVEGRVVAVDVSSVFRGRCTVLAGGTDPAVPGVAKVINLYHLEWACDRGLEEVDFLCGDFNWKSLFHLTPRPLHLFSSMD